jgi:tight adherence protein C
MSNETMIIFISSLLAALSFIAIVLPILNRADKKDKYKALIKDRRQTLYQDTVEEAKGGKSNVVNQNARENVAAFFKVEQLVGKAATNVRKKLNQAGYRGQNAPLKFMLIKTFLPVILVMMGIMVMSKIEDLESSIALLVLFSAALAGWFLPGVLVKNQADKRQLEINQNFPDALDMILVCVQGGISLEQAIIRISDEISDQSQILAEELGLLSAELGLLSDRRQAFSDFADRVGSGAAKSFGTAMIQAEKYGTSISQALRVMADELRDLRMAAAEQKAASLPPKLTVPMILFFLPSLFIAILGPAGIQATGGGG